jgi:hypothetical protein
MNDVAAEDAPKNRQDGSDHCHVSSGGAIEVDGLEGFGVKQERLERLKLLLQRLVHAEEKTGIEVSLNGLVSMSPAALALFEARIGSSCDGRGV